MPLWDQSITRILVKHEFHGFNIDHLLGWIKNFCNINITRGNLYI